MARPGANAVLAAQALRFAVAGGVVTLFSTALYLALTHLAAIPPPCATLIGYVLAVPLSYWLHARWTFAAADTPALARFVLASLSALLLNLGWASLGAGLGWPPSAAAVPMMIVTPALSFLINRNWVFARRPRQTLAARL